MQMVLRRMRHSQLLPNKKRSPRLTVEERYLSSGGAGLVLVLAFFIGPVASCAGAAPGAWC